MANINKSEIVQRIVKALRLDPGIEAIPRQIAEKVLPVFVINEIGGERVIFDNSLNNSSKSFTVPEGHKWRMKWVFTKFISTATVGNRQLAIKIANSDGNEVFRAIHGITQAASTTRYYVNQPRMGAGTIANLTSFGTLPPVLYEGMVLNIKDTSAVAASADDMEVSVVFEEMSMEA